jgi:hypothetical protein
MLLDEIPELSLLKNFHSPASTREMEIKIKDISKKKYFL